MLSVDKIDAEIEKLRQTKISLIKRKLITCPNCHKKTQLEKATVIREHHYISPRGCTDGDYWLFSNEYHYYCKKCEQFSRVYQHRQWDSNLWEYVDEKMPADGKNPRLKLFQLIHKNLHHIGEVIDSYDDNGTIHELRRLHEKRNEVEEIY